MDVLPGDLKLDLDTSIAREYEWVIDVINEVVRLPGNPRSVRISTWRGSPNIAPTVISNVLTRVVLATVLEWDWLIVALCVSMALFYTAGMYLNDILDLEIDRVQRPRRPIPSGIVPAPPCLDHHRRHVRYRTRIADSGRVGGVHRRRGPDRRNRAATRGTRKIPAAPLLWVPPGF
ncbi:MAG: UbiA family prenyltransferase [Thermomicrobiales bacterium]